MVDRKTYMQKYHKQWALKHKDARRKSFLKRRYGITPEQYDAILQTQHGKCAICGKPDEGNTLAVDHDHETSRVRGLLCDQCNVGLGNFKDNLESLVNAISYLKR